MNDHIKFEGNTLRESPQFEAKAEDFASQLRSCNMDSDDGNIHGAARKIPFNPNAIYPLKFAEDCGCNTTDEVLLAQVNANIRRGLPQARPHMPNSTVVALVCGGPSLKLTEKELARVAWSGAKVVAVNGAYQWCIDRNIRPSAAVMLDAREFNSRFFQEPVEGCKYFLASQCHPATYEVCRDREVYVWHACTTGEPELEIITDYYFAKAYPVTIGTTVAIRAIGLFRMLGFQYFEIFGLDSCWLGDEHHAYPQEENNERQLALWLRPQDRDDLAQRFLCAPWHMKQAQDFMELVQERGDAFNLNVHGPGLIATILRTGAQIQSELDGVEVPAA